MKISNIILFLLLLTFVSNSYALRKPGDKVVVGNTTFMIWGGAKAGIMPKGATVSHDGKWLFVSNFGKRKNKNISVFKADPMTFYKYINYKGNSIELAVSSDNKILYSTNMIGHYLDIIDLTTFSWKKHIKIRGFPKIILLSPDNKNAYLSLWEGRGIARVNLLNYKVDKFHTGQKHPRGLALSKDLTKMYIANNGNRSYSILDMKSLIPGQRPIVQHFKVGRGPRHIIASRDGKRIYLSVMSYNAIFVIDAVTNKLIKKVKVGFKPKTIEESYDGKFLYTANYTGHSMSIIDTNTFESKELPLDIVKASGLTIRTDDKFIYVTGWCSDDIWAIQRINQGETPQKPLGQRLKRHLCRSCKISFMSCEPIK